MKIKIEVDVPKYTGGTDCCDCPIEKYSKLCVHGLKYCMEYDLSRIEVKKIGGIVMLPFYFDLKKFKSVLSPTDNCTLAIWDTGYRFQGRKWYHALRDIRITIRTKDQLVYVIKKGDAI